MAEKNDNGAAERSQNSASDSNKKMADEETVAESFGKGRGCGKRGTC